MSVLKLSRAPSFFIKQIITPTLCGRRYCQNEPLDTAEFAVEENSPDTKKKNDEINVETSIRYMQSEAYKETYGNKPVWDFYIRNFKGTKPPKTRLSCKYNGEITTWSPCPICRDKYLVVHHENLDLLKQFISSASGTFLDSKITGVCQKQQLNIVLAVEKAKRLGLLVYSVPHRYYNYSEYIKK